MTNGYVEIRFAGSKKVYFMDGIVGCGFASYEDNMKWNRSQPYSIIVKPVTGAEITVNEVRSHTFREGKAPNWTVVYFDECYDLQVMRFVTREQAQKFANYCEFGVLAIVGTKYEDSVIQAWLNDHPED